MRILLADDHGLVRDGLKPFLEELDEQAVIDEAASLDEALDRAASATYGLALLDLNMPGMDGAEGVRRFRAAHPDARVVVLTGSLSRDDVLACDGAGAAGYLTKTMSGTAIVNALRLILSGEKFLPSHAFGPSAGVPAGGGPSAADPRLGLLTEREREVLALLAQGNSNKEIARALDLQEVTVKAHLKKVFRKLNVTSRVRAAKAARDIGL